MTTEEPKPKFDYYARCSKCGWLVFCYHIPPQGYAYGFNWCESCWKNKDDDRRNSVTKYSAT